MDSEKLVTETEKTAYERAVEQEHAISHLDWTPETQRAPAEPGDRGGLGGTEPGELWSVFGRKGDADLVLIELATFRAVDAQEAILMLVRACPQLIGHRLLALRRKFAEGRLVNAAPFLETED